MAAHLTSIGFEVTLAGDTLDVVVPTWRCDTATETYFAEEVGRMFGYENIPRTVPKGDDPGGLSQYQKDRRLVRDVLLGAGCDETLPMPFLAPGDLAKAGLPEDGVTLTNPLHAEESVLRTSLLPGQLKAIVQPVASQPRCAVLRDDHVFLPAAEGEILPDDGASTLRSPSPVKRRRLRLPYSMRWIGRSPCRMCSCRRQVLPGCTRPGRPMWSSPGALAATSVRSIRRCSRPTASKVGSPGSNSISVLCSTVRTEIAPIRP